MIPHLTLGKSDFDRKRNLKMKITSGEIQIGGNKNLKIYGRLDCSSGKRMKIENRVFFASQHEAIHLGYRPCGNCMRKEYNEWRLKNRK